MCPAGLVMGTGQGAVNVRLFAEPAIYHRFFWKTLTLWRAECQPGVALSRLWTSRRSFIVHCSPDVLAAGAVVDVRRAELEVVEDELAVGGFEGALEANVVRLVGLAGSSRCRVLG